MHVILKSINISCDLAHILNMPTIQVHTTMDNICDKIEALYELWLIYLELTQIFS